MTKAEEASVQKIAGNFSRAVESAWKRNEPLTLLHMELALVEVRRILENPNDGE